MPSFRSFQTHGSEAFRKLTIALAITSIVCACGRDPLSSGAELLRKGDLSGAVIEFKNAVQDNPQSTDARLALANALERTSDPVGAEQQLRKAVENGGDAEKIVPRIALLMLDRGEHAKIVSEFSKRTLQTAPGISNLKAILSMAETALGHSKQASDLLENLPSETTLTLLAKGQAFARQGNSSKALEQLDQAIKQADKEDAAIWWTFRALHRTYAATGEPSKALAAIKAAHEVAPWHIGIAGEYGDALIGANQFADATSVRDQLKTRAPNHYWTNYLDAVLLAEKGNIEGSHAAGLKVLAIAPNHLRSNLIVASAELQNNNVPMAEERLRKALHEHPRHLALLQLYATAQMRNGNYAAAAETIDRGLRLSPDDPRLLTLSTDLAVLKKDTSSAKKTLQRLLVLNGKDGQSLMRLAELSIMEKKLPEAGAYLREALPYVQDDPNLRDRTIVLALNSENSELARRLSEYALQKRAGDPGTYLTVAALKEYQKDPAGARQAALKALDIKADYQPALNALGNLSRSTEEQRELLGRYEQAIATKPSTPATYLTYMRLVRSMRSDESKIIVALENGIAANPTATAIRATLIDELLRDGKFDNALSVAQSGASITNAPAELSGLLAATYERLGKTEQAAEVYRKLAANYPQRSDWRLKLAELTVRTGKIQEARSILRSLMTDAPFEAASYIALAKLTARDNLSEALSIARQLGEKKINQGTAMLLEGDVLVLAGKQDDALQQFSKATKLGAMPDAAISTAQLLDATARKPAADQELSDALRKFPAHPQLLSYIGQRHLHHGNTTKAAEYLQKALAVDPRNPALINDLAWVQIQLKQPMALDNARIALSMQPNNPAILDTYGMALLLTGEKKAAISNLRAAVNLNPYAQLPKIHLAEAFLSSDYKQSARDILKSIQDAQVPPTEHETLARLRKESGT